MLTSDAPPWVTNGSGMPVIGMIPRTIPTLTTSWNRIIEATPAANSVPNGVARPPAGHEDAPEQQHEQHEQHDAADEAELLGEDREHEVGGLDGQEVALRLRPVRQALAEPARRSRPRSAPGRAGSPAPWMSGLASRNDVSRSFW